MPTPISWTALLTSVIDYATIMKPFYFISHMQVSNDFTSISERHFQAYLENLKPSSSDVWKCVVTEFFGQLFT